MLWPQIHGEPRHPQLLLAGGVELGKLGDGGYLTEQPQSIKTSLLNGAGRPRQLGRPAHLALDLLDEEANLLGGPFRLLALNADQRLGVLAVGKKISNRPLLSRAMQTTARNRPTYFRNS